MQLHNLLENMIQLVEEMQSETGCTRSNREIGILLGQPEENIAQAITELASQGVIQRKLVNSVRQLSLDQKRRRKRKESGQRKEKEEEKQIEVQFATQTVLNNLKASSSESLHHAKPPKRARLSERQRERLAMYAERAREDRLEIPASIEELVDFWNNLGLKKCWKRNTKTFQTTVLYLKRLRRGLLYELLNIPAPLKRRYNREEIFECFKRFHLVCNDPDYEPIKGSFRHQYLLNLTLKEFLLNERTESEEDQSLFLHYFYNPPQKVKYTQDRHPKVSSIFREYYVQNVLGQIRPSNGFRKADEFHFRKAAERTVEFIKDNLHKMNVSMLEIRKREDFARVVCDAIEWDVRGEVSKITPGWFSSDTTFHKRLPTYLYKEGVIEEEGWLV